MKLEVLSGDCIDHMRNVIPPQSIHCIVSSPPYWGLRDYGIPGRLWSDGTTCVYGNEPTVAKYLTHTLELFEAMRTVLRPDGVIWWNIGDTYSSGGRTGYDTKSPNKGQVCNGTRPNDRVPEGNKMMLPHRVAIALQDAGWCIRQDNIWAKPAPMPESISGWFWTRCRVKVANGIQGHPIINGAKLHSGDIRNTVSAQWSDCPGCSKCEANAGYVLRRGKWRNTTGHEYIFQITQGGNYFCDAAAAAETAVGGSPGNKTHKGATAYAEGDKHHRTKVGLSQMVASTTRNPRSVWKFAAESFKGAHFATFPTELPYRCITASTSPAGCCPHCGNQWAPVIDKIRRPTRPGEKTKLPGRNSRAFVDRDAKHGNEYREDRFEQVVGNRDPLRHCTVTIVTEYRSTCTCPTHIPVPATVYDPFGGSLTTAAVAHHMGRNAVTSELNESYIGLGDARIAKTPKAIADRRPHKKRQPRKRHKSQRHLFAPVTE